MQTALRGMQGHLVVRVEVNALYDVDLAVVRPCRALRPECWPHGAAVGYVQSVDDPQTAVVVEVLRRKSDLINKV